jgi:hypothetical protein
MTLERKLGAPSAYDTEVPLSGKKGRLLRRNAPTAPKPAASSSQVEGSGTTTELSRAKVGPNQPVSTDGPSTGKTSVVDA